MVRTFSPNTLNILWFLMSCYIGVKEPWGLFKKSKNREVYRMEKTIAPLCGPIYAANPLGLVRGNLAASSSYAFPVQPQMYLLMWMQLFTRWMKARVKCVIYRTTSGFYYVLDAADNEGAQRPTALSLPLVLPRITHTQKHTHTRTGIFHLSGV